MLLVSWLGTPVPRAAALDPRRAPTDYRRQSWGPEDGLPCNNVYCVTQADDGYLWLGTEEGLVRFDGVRAQVFDRQSDPVLLGHTVSSVLRDARHPGQLLLSGTGGLCQVVGGKIQALPTNHSLAGQLGRIQFQDPGGNLWIITSRGLLWVTPAGAVSDPVEGSPGWPAEKIRTVCQDGTGRLWVGTFDGLYRQREASDAAPNFELVSGWAGRGVDYLAAARGGGVWVGSRDAGSGHLDVNGVFHPRAALAGHTVSTVLEDRAGMLWVGTLGGGLRRLPADETGDASTTPAPTLTTDNGLVSNVVTALCEDREGNLWVATDSGIQVLRDVRFVNFGRLEGLGGNDVRTIFEDRSGRVWIGHENGLASLEPGTGRLTDHSLPPSPRRPSDTRVLCLDEEDGGESLLIGTHASGLLRWREGKVEPLPLRDDLDRSQVRALCRDLAGNRWVGTTNGLYQVRGTRVLARLTTAEGLANDKVHALLADRSGNLWVATAGGLSRREPDGQITNFLVAGTAQAASSVLSLYEPPERPGELFVGTELGLHRLRTGGDGQVQIIRYTVQQGLYDDLAWAVLGDDQGNLWMSSNRGVCRVAIADLERFDRGEIPKVPHVSYGVVDGMRSRECNGAHQPAAWRDHRGQLWFATVKGAAMVDPARVEPNRPPPPVHVEELVADGHPVPLQADGTRSGGVPLTLAAGTQKFDFRYTALSLAAPETNRFRTRLEPIETHWTEAGTERVAHYTNLPPGHYTFRVLAANADGVWNEAGASLALDLRPFFYQTGWWRGLVLVSTGALLGLVYLGLRRRWQRRLADAQAELAERTRTQVILRQANEKAETARQEAEEANAAKGEFLSRLSHELRTPLNAILGFGQLLEMEKLPQRQLQSVEHILGGGRHLLGLVDEILDLSRVENGAVPLRCEKVELAPLLREAAALIKPLAAGSGVALHVEGAGAATMVLADRQRLKQVLLNLLANAVKYNRPGGGGEVVLGVQEAAPFPPTGEPGARVFVRDTGIGIDAAGLAKLFTPFERLGAAYGPIEGTGLGLTISKALTEAMGGTIGVESQPGAGSTFWVELPLVAAPPLGDEAHLHLSRPLPRPDLTLRA